MEVYHLDLNSLKIKGKQGILVVNPTEKNKTTTDAALLLGNQTTNEFFRPEVGVIFQSSGEYEVKGIKVTGFKVDGETMYTLIIDGMSVFVGNVSSALKAKDKLHEHDIAIFITDDILPQNIMGVLNASVIIFAGEKLPENAKAFSRDLAKVGKYVVTKDKLPTEPEFVFLG